MLENSREWVASNIATLIFLGFYSFTVVAGNALYATPVGSDLLKYSKFPTDLLEFPTSFTFGFWALLLLPYLAVPILVPPLKYLARRVVPPFTNVFPEFRRLDYTVIAIIAYAIAFRSLWKANAVGLSEHAATPIASINARFALLGGLSFVDQVFIQAIVPFLAFYAVVSALREGGLFWRSVSLVNITLASIILVLLNMKWPVLVFYVGIVSAIFVFSKQYAYSKALFGVITLVFLYLLISTYVFRWTAVSTPAPIQASTQTPKQFIREKPIVTLKTESNAPLIIAKDATEIAKKGNKIITDSGAVVKNAIKYAPFLFGHVINRAAVAYPYYYNIFSEEGAVCGTLYRYVTPGKKPCVPSYLVYSHIFPGDGFAGRGSAPEGPHITGYALGGWPGAFLGIFGTCVLLTIFCVLPYGSNAMTGAFAVVGATVGYHLSQLPGEGPIIYVHGFLWPFLLVSLYALYRCTAQSVSRSLHRRRNDTVVDINHFDNLPGLD